MALVDLSVVEQRYRAVLAVERGEPKMVVAAQFGVSRQTLHTWLTRYQASGLAGLMDRSAGPIRVRIKPTRRSRRGCVSYAGSTRGGVRGGSLSSWPVAPKGAVSRRGNRRCIASCAVTA